MIKLSAERVNEILLKETPVTEKLPTILRAVYNRYMQLFERYFDDIDALNDDKVAELKKYHDETKALIMYYYMDIPLDLCLGLEEYDKKYTSKLFKSDWHKLIFESFRNFRDDNEDENKSKTRLKAEFQEKVLTEFYVSMNYVFREAFGTGSKTAEQATDWLGSLLFGEE